MATDPKPVGGQSYKLVIVGDGMVGKTSLLISYVHKTFQSDYVPTVLETYAQSIVVDEVQVPGLLKL